VGYDRIEDLARLREKIRELPPSGVRILHIRTNRTRDMALRSAIADYAQGPQ
jgi:hypothetical protein